jgi:hypothetical protein
MSTGFPSTFTAAAPAGRAQVFDPALKQFAYAFRPGDPTFTRPEDAARWHTARRRATDHVLRTFAESEWGDSLVLRGSRLLAAWLPEQAREPGDLDWVAEPASMRLPSHEATRLLNGLMAAVRHRPSPAGVYMPPTVSSEDIWTYERAAGRRMVFPFKCEGLPDGAVQVDVVFSQELPSPPARTVVPAADGGCVAVRAATPEQSLAWKLLWLATDMYPQGKDLYDAVLLAEHTNLRREVLTETFNAARQQLVIYPGTPFLDIRVDWENFQRECPWVTGTEDEWRNRLDRALEREGPPADRSAGGWVRPEWRTADVLAITRGIVDERAFDRLAILHDALIDAGCTDERILGHCRDAGPHGSECWVTNVILADRADTPAEGGS